MFERIIWHTLGEGEVLTKLETTRAGLNTNEVGRRQREFGPNRLPAKPPPSVLSIVIDQFLSPLIYILLLAAVISLLIGERTDAMFIFAILVLNASLGAVQEWKAEKSAAALQSLLKVCAHVRRDGQDREITADELVPGDICLLESGNRVPADIRLLEVKNLAIDESLLTGESLATVKSVVPISDSMTPISERTNVAYGGTTVMVGRGVGVVVEIGIRTEVAEIAKTVAESEETKTPLVLRMDQFARYISGGVVGACILLAVAAVRGGIPFTEVFFMAVALAVSAIPEGLPVAMTIALSVATSRMAKRNVIVRKLTAVEGLGSCTCIESDKTGTLTVNQQTVKKIVLPTGEWVGVSGQGYSGVGEVLPETGEPIGPETWEGLRRLGMVGIVCNESQLMRERGEWSHHGDAVDVALLALGYKLALDPPGLKKSITICGLIPFESERRFAATFYRESNVTKVAVKGATEEVLLRCDGMVTDQGEVPIEVDRIEKEAMLLATQGYRVLALAEATLPLQTESEVFEEHHLPTLTLLGLVGSIDPLRSEVKQAVKECREAGITVAMVTGDHPATALAISRELGIAESEVEAVTGRQLAEIGSSHVPQFLDVVDRVRVFARFKNIRS